MQGRARGLSDAREPAGLERIGLTRQVGDAADDLLTGRPSEIDALRRSRYKPRVPDTRRTRRRGTVSWSAFC